MELNFAADDERTAFLDAVEESLRPLMRAVFAYGISYQDLVEVVRALFTFALRDRYESQGRPANETSLSLAAGVTRGEVMKLVTSRRVRDEQRAFAAKRFDQLTQLLGRWHDDPRFSTPYGAPLDLSMQPEGSFRTLDELLEASETELDRETAIVSLKATGCVEIHFDKFMRCTSRTFRPGGKDLSKIARLGRITGALNSNFVHNLLRDSEQPSYFEKTMVSDFPLSESGRNAMLAQLRGDGEDFVDGIDKWVLTKAVEYMDDGGKRFGVTAFFFEDTAPSSLSVAYPQSLGVSTDSNLAS